LEEAKSERRVWGEGERDGRKEIEKEIFDNE